ncbi:MAG: hypothetical protein R3246_15340, partial [Acidimicrobiia bacterium]|nr:hypothetical protein [Acidimicrobiia bacterium]
MAQRDALHLEVRVDRIPGQDGGRVIGRGRHGAVRPDAGELGAVRTGGTVARRWILRDQRIEENRAEDIDGYCIALRTGAGGPGAYRAGSHRPPT